MEPIPASLSCWLLFNLPWKNEKESKRRRENMKSFLVIEFHSPALFSTLFVVLFLTPKRKKEENKNNDLNKYTNAINV